MKYLFNDNGTEIEIPLERWAWGVVYNDGTELHQFDKDGRFHRIGEIEQEKINMAILYKPEDEGKRIDIPWREGMRLIHKYRNIVFDYMGESPREVRIFMFGYKDGSHHSILYVLPDDRIVFSNDEHHDITQHNP